MEAAWHRVPGGTGRVAVDLANALSRRNDIEIEGVAAWHLNPPSQNYQPSIDVQRLRCPRPLLYECWARSPRPRLKSAKHHLVHSTTIVVPPPGDVPMVVNVHDLAFRRFPERFPKRSRKLFERSWQRVLERADAVLCPSAATSADLLAAGLDAHRLHLVPLGHDPLNVSPEALLETREQFGVQGKFVLAVGTLEPRKNIPTLIEAFNNIAPSHDVELVLAGPIGWGVTPEELLASLDEAAKNKIRIIGEVTTAQLAALYTDASAFCYPSLLEGFGLPVLEAMSYNTPVVTSKGTATEEVAGDAALMVDPASVDEVSDALDFLLTSESEAQKLADRGYQRSKTFSWDATAAATVDVYRKLT